MTVPVYHWGMSSRIRIFLTGLLTLLIAALLAFAPVGAKPASGGYQLFGGAVSGHQAVISLAALENFDYHAKIAPECCNATNGGELTTFWDKWTPPSGYARNADGTVVHTGSGQVYTPLRDSAGNVRTNSAGDPIFNTQSGGTTAQTTLTKPAASGQVIELPNAPNTVRLTTSDFPQVRTTVSQKQNRHIEGRSEYRGGGTLNSQADAQKVLDAYHGGNAVILGKTSQGFPVVRFNGVTGTNNNVGAGITNQPTNVFIIKGTASPSIVPTNPNWTP